MPVGSVDWVCETKDDLCPVEVLRMDVIDEREEMVCDSKKSNKTHRFRC
jgi:hypothetical protein